MNIIYLCCDPGVDPSGSKGASIHVRSFTRALHEWGCEVTAIAGKINSPALYQDLTGCTALAATLSPWQVALRRVIKTIPQIHGGPPRNHDAASCLSLESQTRRAAFGTSKTGHGIWGGGSVRGRNLVRTLHVAACRRVLEATMARLKPAFIYERYSLWGTAGLNCARRHGIPLVLEVNAPLVDEESRYRAGFTLPALARRIG